MTTGSHVLIVEDDPDIGSTLAELLRLEGYETELATNGAEAITALEGPVRPCAVLVDLLMPGIVGQELLEYLRDDVRLASIPVAIVSASPQLAPAGYQVFRKPLDLRPLLDFLREGCNVVAREAKSAGTYGDSDVSTSPGLEVTPRTP